MAEETAVAVPSIGKLAKIYIKMRIALSELNKQVADLEAQKSLVASAMKDELVAAGCKSMKTDFGTVSLSKTTRYYTNDWPNFDMWLAENALQPSTMFEHRLSQKNMATFLEENPGVVPPGLNSETEISVSVRKPTK